MSSKTIIIAPWGKPENWIYTKYTINSTHTESFTSLEALIKHLEPEKVVVYVADTLIVDYRIPLPSTYQDTIREVEEQVKNKLCGIDGEVIVLPGIISKQEGNVDGHPTDYYMLALYHTLNIILEIEPKVVALDLTHGVNYMPTMLLQATREATALASMVMGKDLTLEAYNSDPVIPNSSIRKVCKRDDKNNDPCRPVSPEECSKLMPTANIHKIISEKITPSTLIPYLEDLIHEGNSLLSARKGLKKPIDRETINKINKLKKPSETITKAQTTIKMVRYGLVPLLIYNALTKETTPDTYQDVIKNTLNTWKDGIKIDNNTITRLLNIKEGFRKVLYAYALTKGIEKNAGNGTLEDAFKLADLYYRGNSILGIIQQREKNKITNAFKQKQACQKNQEITLKKLLDKEDRERNDTLGGCQVFRRDLIAHGGWYDEIITFQCTGNNHMKAKIDIRKQSICRYNNKKLDVFQVINEVL